MSIKKQKYGLPAWAIFCLLMLSSYGANAETTADENSLANRLKAFNSSESVSNKAIVKKSVVKKSAPKKAKVAVKKRKTKVAKRRSRKRACYKSSASAIRDRAESFQPSIRNSSRRYGVSEALIMSVITAESCFAQHARSHKNARGLMQLIPATAKRFGVKNSYVPSQNIKGGTRYLKFLLERFSGNLHLVVAAYNAGEGAVDRYSGIPPYRETKEYVRRVMSVYRRLQDTRDSNLRVKYDNNTVTSRNASARNSRRNYTEKPIAFAKSSTGKGYFIKPDYQWKRKPNRSRKRVAGLYKIAAKTNRRGNVCRDVSSQKLRRNSRLENRNNTMKRFYASSQPKSLSAISRITGVSLRLLLRMNRDASRYMIQPGNKVLVWQCANR